MAQRITIKKGPKKLDFLVTRFVGHSGYRIPAKFEYEGTPEVMNTVYVHGIDPADYSNENWNFYGYMRYEPLWKEVRGFYSTETRSGWIELVDE